MLTQLRCTITSRRLIDGSAIGICNLAKGQLGEGIVHLLGTLTTTGGYQTAREPQLPSRGLGP